MKWLHQLNTIVYVCASALCSNVMATDTLSLLEAERTSLSEAMKITFPSQELARRAAISFHNELLEINWEQNYIIMILDDRERERLKSFNVSITPATDWFYQREAAIQRLQKATVASDRALSQDSIPGFPCYETVEGTMTVAANLAQQFPQLASWIDIGDSWEKVAGIGGYDLSVLKITHQNTGGDKPKLFIHSAMHAREYATAALTLRFAKYLLEGYGHDADVTWVVDHHEVHILFHMNPDGRKFAEQGLYWRKNANQNYCDTNSILHGVDLNRNFSHFWNTTLNGSSGNECDEDFRGPVAASEPETQAVERYIRNLFPDRRGEGEEDAAPLDTTGMHIDVHSFSELILWPLGHRQTAAPNGTELATLGRKLAYFNGYYPTQSVGLYPTDGASDDFSYGELGVAAITFELGQAFFESCTAFEEQILPDNLQALMYAAKVVRAPYVIPAGPDSYDLAVNGGGSTTVTLGSVAKLAFKVSDIRYSTQNGAEGTQAISAAEYYLDIPPWKQTASAIPLVASDGAFDETMEALEIDLDTFSLNPGRHVIYVRGQDADGNWGAVSAMFLTVLDQKEEGALAGTNASSSCLLLLWLLSIMILRPIREFHQPRFRLSK